MMKNFVPGWWQANNSKKFHWFNNANQPLCGKKVPKTDIFLTPWGTQPTQTKREGMSKFYGGCTSCIAKLKKVA